MHQAPAQLPRSIAAHSRAQVPQGHSSSGNSAVSSIAHSDDSCLLRQQSWRRLATKVWHHLSWLTAALEGQYQSVISA